MTVRSGGDQDDGMRINPNELYGARTLFALNRLCEIVVWLVPARGQCSPPKIRGVIAPPVVVPKDVVPPRLQRGCRVDFVKRLLESETEKDGFWSPAYLSIVFKADGAAGGQAAMSALGSGGACHTTAVIAHCPAWVLQGEYLRRTCAARYCVLPRVHLERPDFYPFPTWPLKRRPQKLQKKSASFPQTWHNQKHKTIGTRCVLFEMAPGPEWPFSNKSPPNTHLQSPPPKCQAGPPPHGGGLQGGEG